MQDLVWKGGGYRCVGGPGSAAGLQGGRPCHGACASPSPPPEQPFWDHLHLHHTCSSTFYFTCLYIVQTYDEVQVFVPCTQYGNKSSQKVSSFPIDQSTHHRHSNCHQRDRQQRLGSLGHTLLTSVSWALGGVRGEAHRVHGIWDDRHNVRSQSCTQNCVLFAAGVIT